MLVLGRKCGDWMNVGDRRYGGMRDKHNEKGRRHEVEVLINMQDSLCYQLQFV